jgi:hypothetical protein
MGRSLGVVAVAVLGCAVLAASASAGVVDPDAKVGPDLYIGSASEHGDPDAELPPQVEKLLDAKRDTEPSAKIVGGQATTIQEWPWQTAILDGENGNGFDRQFCGGSLVAPNIVISAAHCFYNETTNSFPPANFDVVTGRTVLSTTAGQELDVDDYFFFVDGGGNPVYDPDIDDQFDVVFIKLTSSSISPTIKIAGPGERAVWTAGRTAFTTGWGSLSSGGPFPDQLRGVQIGMISDPTCASGPVYGASGLFFPATMVCAGVLAGGKDSCQGDSGGPLVVPIAGGGFRLVGDTSFGIGCALPNKPGIYGRIADNPMRDPLAAGILTESGVNVLGSGAQPPTPPTPPPPPPGPSAECLEAQDALAGAKKKVKKAKKKLKKAKKADDQGKIKKAKKKLKKAKRKKKRAKKAVEEAC